MFSMLSKPWPMSLIDYVNSMPGDFRVKCIGDTHKRLKGGQFDRTFDNLNLLSPYYYKQFIKEYKTIVKLAAKSWQENKSQSSIERDESFSRHVCSLVFPLANKVADKTCRDLLDGHGEISTQIIKFFGWENRPEIHTEFNIKQLLSAYYMNTMATIAVPARVELVELNDRGLEAAINKVINSYQGVTQYKFDTTQEKDVQLGHAVLVADQLAKLNIQDFSFLQKLVTDDINNTFKRQAHETAHTSLRKERLVFWIDVMFLLYNKHHRGDLFQFIFDAFQRIFKFEIAITEAVNPSERDQKQVKGDVILIESRREKYHCCIQERERIHKEDKNEEKRPAEIESAKSNKKLHEEIINLLHVRDRISVVMKIDLEFANLAESEINVGEKVLLGELISESKNSRPPVSSAKDLLKKYYGICCRQPSKDGKLAETIIVYLSYFHDVQWISQLCRKSYERTIRPNLHNDSTLILDSLMKDFVTEAVQANYDSAGEVVEFLNKHIKVFQQTGADGSEAIIGNLRSILADYSFVSDSSVLEKHVAPEMQPLNNVTTNFSQVKESQVNTLIQQRKYHQPKKQEVSQVSSRPLSGNTSKTKEFVKKFEQMKFMK